MVVGDRCGKMEGERRVSFLEVCQSIRAESDGANVSNVNSYFMGVKPRSAPAQ